MKKSTLGLILTCLFLFPIVSHGQDYPLSGDWVGRWNYYRYDEDGWVSGQGKTIVRISNQEDGVSLRIKEVYAVYGEEERTYYWPPLEIVSFDKKQIVAIETEQSKGYYEDNRDWWLHSTSTYSFSLINGYLNLTEELVVEEHDHSRGNRLVSIDNRGKVRPIKKLYTPIAFGDYITELRLYKNEQDW